MIPLDTKNYRAHRSCSISGWSVIGIVSIVILLAWMGERDREAHIARIQEASSAKCM